MPNRGAGIKISGFDNIIGGVGSGEGCRIAFNAGPGVVVLQSRGVSIRGNSMERNGGRGISLKNGAVPVNDPRDSDVGDNNRQNYPILTSLVSNSTSTISGTFNSLPNTIFDLDFYASPTADASGLGEGATFLGTQRITTDASGYAAFSFAAQGDLSRSFASATATNAVTGDTIEFSRALLAP